MQVNHSMKHTQNRRHRDFLQTCRLIIRHSARRLRPEELARKALSRQAPEYYINDDYAYRMVLDSINHGKIPIRESTRQMCRELTDRIAELKSRKEGLSTMLALKTVLESGKASRYFMSAKTATNLIKRNYRLLYDTAI